MEHANVSLYRPYLCILPEYEPQPVRDQLDRVNFLLRKQVTSVMNGRVRQDSKTFAQLSALQNKYPDDFPPEHYSMENLSWIRNIVTSRSWSRKSESNPNYLVWHLIPLADMFN